MDNQRLKRTLVTALALLLGAGSQWPGLPPVVAQLMVAAAAALLGKEHLPQSVPSALVLLLLAGALNACGSSPGQTATPTEATVVVMGQRMVDVTNDDGTLSPGIEDFPACMGVAIARRAFLTSDHCDILSPYVYVDEPTWVHTSTGKSYADDIALKGEVRTVAPRTDLPGWAPRSEAHDGGAEIIVIRGSDFATLQTEVVGTSLSANVQHGDSGAGVFQQGALVGLVQACNSSDGKMCDLGGGRFSSVLP